MDWNKVWFSTVGGGAGGALFVGGGVFLCTFQNVGSPGVADLQTLVICKRLGLVAHAGAQHAVALLTGVSCAHEVNGLTASGFDFALDIGYKIGDSIKAATKIGALAKSVIVATGKAAQQEAAKKLAQGLMGDLAADQRGRAFYLIGTPLGGGIGAGIYYEWQSIYPLGGRLAWEQSPPKWKIDNVHGNVVLRMKNVPAADGERIEIRIRVEAWGTDYVLRFAFNQMDPESSPTWSSGLVGTARKHEIWYENPVAGAHDGLGIPLSLLKGHVRGYEGNHKPWVNRSIRIGVDVRASVTADGQVWQPDMGARICTTTSLWESKAYATVHVDGRGDICRAPATDWLD